MKKTDTQEAMFLIKGLCKAHSCYPQVLHRDDWKTFARKGVSKSVTEPSAQTSKHLAHCWPVSQRKRVGKRLITVAGGYGESSPKEIHTKWVPREYIAQTRWKSQWIRTKISVQKSPSKRQQVCYCRLYTGRCCHVAQWPALILGVDGGHGRPGSPNQRVTQRYQLTSATALCSSCGSNFAYKIGISAPQIHPPRGFDKRNILIKG